MGSWRTALLGVLLFVQALVTALVAQIDLNPETIPDWNMVVTTAIAMAGFILARDNKTTDEEAGAK
jgi:hypothetical protein